MKKTDEVWLIVDKDQWTDEQLNELFQWVQADAGKGAKRNLALSNPSFEYWLLLHFDEGNNISGNKQCIQRLRQYWPEYKKGTDLHKHTKLAENIALAVERARKRDTHPSTAWPRNPGSTTVYRLVEKLLGLESKLHHPAQ